MIIALLALAFAMILGGLLATFFGWDIVLIERGWTMVLAGSFSAACGALLLGITAAVSKLAQIQSELARLQVAFDEEVREEAPSSSTGLSMAALAGGLLGGRMFGRGDEKGRDEKPADLPSIPQDPMFEAEGEGRDQGPEQPNEKSDELDAPRFSDPFLPFPSRTASDDAERREDDVEAEVRVPDFLLAERLRETYVESRDSGAELSIFADEPKLDQPKLDEPKLDESKLDGPEEERPADLDRDDILEPLAGSVAAPEPEPVREPEPIPAEEEPAAPEEPSHEEKAVDGPRSGATVIGTYNSGDNTYVMFSDGSIEAQTPGGVFHFKSLDELKAFIASGGEGGTTAT